MALFSDIRHFFYISRPLNILMSGVTFLVSSYISQGKAWDFMVDPLFWATLATILLIAATGYWINDVYDFRIDRINKPKKTVINAYLSVKKVLTAYFTAILVILVFSFYFFVFRYDQYQITFINIVSIALLFWYASVLKRKGVAGNLLISFLISLVILLAGYLYHLNLALVWTLLFAFQITFIREITKDVEDIRGDLRYQLRTLPIQIGIRNTKKILLVLYLVFLLSTLFPTIYYYTEMDTLIWAYALGTFFLVQVPTGYLVWLLIQASHPTHFSVQSRYLKRIMVTGLITLLLLP